MKRAVSSSVALLLAVLVAWAAPARAQETQVPFDRAGHFRTLDARAARRAGVFADSTRGFQEARLFRLPDSTFVLELTSVREGELVRERSALTGPDVEALRSRFETLPASLAGPVAQDGQAALAIGATALGLGFYSWALPLAFSSDDQDIGVAPYMLALSSSVFVPLLVANQGTVTYAMSNLALYGATRGIAHGLLLRDAVSNHDPADAGGHPGVRAAVIGSVVEGVAGYAWAQQAHLSNGTASTIATGGDFGMLEGDCVAWLAGAFDGDRAGEASTMILVGGAAGVAGGRVLAGRRDYSYGDASVMRTVGALGAWAGLAATSGAHDPSDRPQAAAVLAGSLAGLALGDRLVAHKHFTAPHAITLEVATLMGGVLGAGIADPSVSDGPRLALASLAGGIGGFALEYARFSRDADRAGAEGSPASWDVGITPLPSLHARGTRTAIPAMAVRYRF